ncbi:MAG: DUF4870 domain-containing protein [Candidatus Omnitrophica bacterium]|nr:DUF4870 domain-containing protein [Candidatus Omnitrophota bacterium]
MEDQPIPSKHVMDPRQERNWAVGIHLSQLALCAGILFGNLIIPLVIWLIKKNESPLIDHEGKKVLNFQISMMIYFIVTGLTCFILIGFILVPVLFILDVIFIIIGSVNTSNGIDHKYPFTIEFIR